MLEPYADDLAFLMIDPVSRPDYSPETPLVLDPERDELLEYRGKYAEAAKQSKLNVAGFDWLLEPSYEWEGCALAWQNIWIQPNGDTYFCYNYSYVLGNVFDSDPLEIWNNPKARAFRSALRTQHPPLKQCHCCNFARLGWQVGGVYIRTKLRRDIEHFTNTEPTTLDEKETKRKREFNRQHRLVGLRVN